MKGETFVDTSGFYALLVGGDERHRRAKNYLARAARSGATFVTTDYVLDETATLLLMRGHGHLLEELFAALATSRACRTEWMDPERFEDTRRLFLKHRDQGFSFTDCFSFLVMKELGLSRALSSDRHFRVAGFEPLLA